MKAFTARVELHKAGNIENFYDHFHTEMKAQGFSKTMIKDGLKVKLPTEEYNLEGDFTCKEVLKKLKKQPKK